MTTFIVNTPAAQTPLDHLRNFASVVLEETGHAMPSDLGASVQEAIDHTEHHFASGDILAALRRSTALIDLLGKIAREHDLVIDAAAGVDGIWVVTRND